MSELSMSQFASLTDYKAALKARQAAKKVVQYESANFFNWFGDKRAVVVPVDHPDTVNVTNGRIATTSTVLNFDEASGCFETKNTIYVPKGAVVVDDTDET